MAKIYLSSTYEDLKDYRRAVFEALRKGGHQVIAMEDYVAADQRPVEECLKNVEKADFYIGLFGFRYGYVPPPEHYNPNGWSITELEFRHAQSCNKPCLIFMAKEDVGIPLEFVDAYTGQGEGGRQIKQLRKELLESVFANLFQSPHHLATEVLAAVTQHLVDKEQTEASSGTVKSDWPDGKSPYPGLMWFDEEYSPLFFGRDREVDELLAKINEPDCRFLIVSGAPSSGKSSLVAAGLWHALIKEGRLPGSAKWIWLRMQPGDGDRPMHALVSSLKHVFPKISQRPIDLANQLAENETTIGELLATHLPGKSELLLFIDQLEELFNKGFNEEGIQNFLDQLVANTRDKSNRLRVVTTVRSDAIAQLEASESVLALLNGGYNYLLGPVSPRVLLDVIERPAMATGYSFESNLVDEIFGDAVEGSDSLLFVAYVLNQLFEHRIGLSFTRDAYKKIRVDARQRIERYKKAAFARTVKEKQRELEDYKEDVYQTNLQSRIVLECVEFEKVPFYTDLAWSLRPQVNVLLGRNGYGKSLLIRALLSLIQQDDEQARKLISDGVGRISLQRNENALEILFKKEYFEETNSVGKVPVLAIPDGRFVNRSVTTISLPGREHGEPEGNDPGNLARHGAWHFLREKPYENTIRTLLYGLCLDYFQKEHSFDQELFTLVAKVVRYLTDQSFDFDRIERVGRDGFTLYVRTEGNENTPVPIQKASQGTLSVFAIVGLIYDYLRALRPEPDPQSVASRSGIVLIDEIDAHLHPIWQQKILSLLRESFPNVQFIVSAHSPLVVAGCLEDEVAVLRRLPEKGVSLVQFPNDFIGWLPEEIYAKVFQVEGKDEPFNRFYALTPFKGKIELRIADLAKIKLPTIDQQNELNKLESQLYYLEKTERRRSEHDNGTRIAQERDSLKTKVMQLERKLSELESLQGK